MQQGDKDNKGIGEANELVLVRMLLIHKYSSLGPTALGFILINRNIPTERDISDLYGIDRWFLQSIYECFDSTLSYVCAMYLVSI